MKLKKVKKPSGYEGEYAFFRDEDGNLFKARAEFREAAAAAVNSDEKLAPVEFAVTVSVSPSDETGKALRENDKPIVGGTLTHVFNEVEMTAPDFDPAARLVGMVEARIAELKARESRIAQIQLAVTDLLN